MLLGKKDGGGGAPLLGEGFSFDEVTRGVASGEITRGRALKLAGAAVLSGALFTAGFASPAEARRRRNVCRHKPDLCKSQSQEALCKGSQSCACLTTTSGKKACEGLAREPCPQTDECNNNDDCPNNDVCVNVSGCCQSANNLCVPKRAYEDANAAEPASRAGRSFGPSGGRGCRRPSPSFVAFIHSNLLPTARDPDMFAAGRVHE